MISQLGEKLQDVFKKMRGYGKLDEKNIADALRDVRMALLAADVHFQIAKDFCERVKQKSMGEEFQKSIRPGDLFVKLVHDELIAVFSAGEREIVEARPLTMLMCGLNGAGKTTTSAKLARFLKKQGEIVILIAADLSRPAAAQQLQILGKQIEVEVIVPEGSPQLLDYLKTAKEAAQAKHATVMIFDTAGRTEVNEELQEELRQVHGFLNPQECLLVADAATGQAAVDVAKAFQASGRVTGLVLSKFDGDARGGAALSLQTVTGCPIKFLGTGEKVEALEVFQPERLVTRMLGMGDIVGLVEKAQEGFDMADAAKMQEKFKSQNFNLQDFLDQMRMLKKLGPLQNLLGMLPGMNNIPSSSLDENAMKRTEAIVCSMTPKERRNPDILNARRRLRIAAGSGTSVPEVNDLLRNFKMMKKFMSKFSRGGNQEKMMKRLMGGMSG
jgi:signal recognition particle subunit SRP54